MALEGIRIAGLFGGRKAEATDAAIAAAALRSDRFRQEREADWLRLDMIVKRMEAGRIGSLSDEDLLALPVLYRTVASSLAVARETSLDAATLAYLESLVQRAYYLVYGPRLGFFGWLRRFLGGGWGAAVRGMWFDLLIALVLMIAGFIGGWLLVSGDVEWYRSIVPAQFTDTRVPGASAQVLRETLFGNANAPDKASLATYLFRNNAGVAIMAFALGFAFGVPTLLLLIHNMAVIGAMVWLFDGQGLGLDFIAWLSIHGTTELLAILLAGAAGLHVGRSMAFPGNRPVLAATAEAGRRASLVMVGVVLMLVVAALLEGFARQLVDNTPARLTIGGTMLALWLAYLFAWRGPALRETAP